MVGRTAIATAAALSTLAACTDDGADTAAPSPSDTTVTSSGAVPDTDGCAPSPATDDPMVARLVDAASSAMDEHHLRAAVVRVERDGTEVVTFALGDSMTGVPADPAMHFRNGAVAITYLGTVLLQLVDEGIVDLDEPVGTWLPDLPASDTVTLRMLATSTSGYADYVGNAGFEAELAADPFRQWEQDELLAVGLSEPMWYEPGTNWNYAHTNFVILGQALEEITGASVADLIRERVLEPLEMAQTGSSDTPAIPEPVLHAFTSERGMYEESTFWSPSWTIGAGSVMTTDICDLARSAHAIGTGELVSDSSHDLQVGPELVGQGGATPDCPAPAVCREQLPGGYYGMGTFVLGGWVYANPFFNGFGAVQAYLADLDLTIAASATLGEDADVGVNGGDAVFRAVAAVLAPDHPPRP